MVRFSGNIRILVIVVILALLVTLSLIWKLNGDEQDIPLNNSENDSGRNYCSKERVESLCMQLYDPVCGWFDHGKIQCLKYPCARTFSNSCFACQDVQVDYWVTGECPA